MTSKAYRELQELSGRFKAVRKYKEECRTNIEDITEELVRSSKSIACIKDLNGKVLTISNPYEAHFGILEEEYKGHYDRDFSDNERHHFYKHDMIVIECCQTVTFMETWYNPLYHGYEKGKVIKHPWFKDGRLSGIYMVIPLSTLKVISKEEHKELLKNSKETSGE